MNVHDLTTPALVVDGATLDANIDAMAAARPGGRLRPHVKAFKSTALARHVARRGGHSGFCAATMREVEGMVDAGLGEDLLLANETLDGVRLAALADRDDCRVTIAVDSPETIEAASGTGIEVLVDVDVGLPRCGVPPDGAGPIAQLARDAGLTVRGVMGYEGHVVGNPDRKQREAAVEESMTLLRSALEDVGGGITSAGGTGTFDMHPHTDEVQAGSYLLMDTAYDQLGLPFGLALELEATVISHSPRGWMVLDCGLKSLGMDHGEPTIQGYNVFFCSDEHTTVLPGADGTLAAVGSRLRVVPAHVDPTVAYHDRLHITDGEDVIEVFPVDLRGW
ncbi:MAG: metal-activated pyridoxal enzyme [Actinomycetia bacterium]|nr:metal-activated pyridoxal enzyme [Actinomycetes bacterium]